MNSKASLELFYICGIVNESCHPQCKQRVLSTTPLATMFVRNHKLEGSEWQALAGAFLQEARGLFIH